MIRYLVLSLLCASATAAAVSSRCSLDNTCGGAIAAAFCSCRGPCTIELETNATYTIRPSYGSDAIKPACSVQNVVLDGRGSTILFDGIGGLFYFSHGTISDLTIRNLTIDMPRDHYTLGQVVGSSASTTTFRVDTRVWPGDRPWTTTVLALYGVDRVNNRMGSRGSVDNYGSWTAKWTASNATTASVVVNKKSQYMKNGDWVVLRHAIYDQDAFAFYGPGVRNVVLQDITIYSFPGFGVFGRGMTNFRAVRVRIMRKPGRPFSIAADGIHLDNTRGGSVVIEDCVFDGQGDDGININSHFYEIRGISADRRTFSVYRKGRTASSTNSLPRDRFVFYKRANFDSLGTATVASNKGAVITLADPLPPNVRNYDAAINLNQQPSTTTIRSSVFRANRARGAKLSTPNLSVSGCTFDHTSGPGVVIKNDCADWYEGAFPTSNWTLTNNRFIGNAQGSWQPNSTILIFAQVPVMNGDVPTPTIRPLTDKQVFGGITITNNVISTESPVYAIDASNVNGLVIRNNTLSTAPLRLTFNTNVQTSNNK